MSHLHHQKTLPSPGGYARADGPVGPQPCIAPGLGINFVAKEHPILMSGPMILALLDGRKTQTRRIVKPQPPYGCEYLMNGAFSHALCRSVDRPEVWVRPTTKSIDHRLACPYGGPGDRLWVKETFRVNGTLAGPRVTYRADNTEAFPKGCPDDCPDWTADDNHWRPSIFMRRYANRIALEITKVRVERLQDISVDDALSEGVQCGSDGPWCAVGEYQRLWESIRNGPGSWKANPWVWMIDFKTITN